ncbi:MAG: 4Fe-4S dicluster domain-containing protein [Bacteroidota bacterium]
METESTNKKNKTRRDFFIASSAIAGGLISLSLLNHLKALSTGSVSGTDTASSVTGKSNNTSKNAGDSEGHWYGFGFDIEKCIGCGNCALACKKENDIPVEPFFFRTWVEQYTTKNDETTVIESPNGGIDGFKQSVPEEDIFKSYFVPKTCNHCAKSPCEQVCPVGATFITPDGVVLIDEKYCLGCGYCIQACPYGCRYMHPEKHVADKCTFCYHRIAKGLQPACVEVCPTGARQYGDLHDKKSSLVAFLKEHTCRVLKPQLNTKPKLFYNALSEEVK